MRRTYLFALLLLPAGCARHSSPAEGPARILDLVAGAGSSEVPESPTLAESWNAEEILAEWDPGEGSGQLVSDRAVFEFSTRGTLTLKRLPAEPFDRVRIQMRRAKEGTLQLELRDDQGRTLSRAGLFFKNSDPGQKANLEFLLNEQRDKLSQAAELVLRFPKGYSPVTLTRISLLQTEPEPALPAPGAPELVTLGTDGRRAVGLSSRRPLEGTFEAAPGDHLSFSCGVPQNLESHAPPRLTLEILDADGAILSTRPFEPPVGRWAAQDIMLGGPLIEAGPLRARFTLETLAGEKVTACAITLPRLERAWRSAPTVLLVTSDTHRGDHLGMMNAGVDVQTPLLDELGTRGVAFADCWAAANVTNPAHITIMTGTGVQDHGVQSNDLAASPKLVTLAEAFSAAGWRTYAALSVSHLGWSGLDQGFERLSAPERSQRDSSETLAILEGWLEEGGTYGRPLFVWLHLFDAHGSYKPPAPYDTLYWDDSLDPFDPAQKGQWGEVDFPSWCALVTDPRYVEASYRGEITYQDNALRGLLDRHPRLGRDLVVLVGDHGENLTDQRPNFDHTSLTTATQHVPLIFSGERVPTLGLVPHPVTQLDVGRTLLDLAGLGSSEFPGENLLLIAAGDPPSAPPTRFAMQANALGASAKAGRWYLKHNLYGKTRVEGVRVLDHELFLYDLQEDPDCQRNVIEQNRDTVLRLRTELVHWLVDSRVKDFLTHDRRTDGATLRALATLGYSAGSDLPDDNPWIDPACDCSWCQGYPLVTERAAPADGE